MNPLMIGLFAFIAMTILLLLKLPIAFCMIAVGTGGLLLTSGARLAEYSMSVIPYSSIFSFTLVTIPLFILMGNLANKAGITSELYDTGYKCLGWLPGGLAIATVFASAGFAATTGSSVGMVAAMARIALPEMDRYGYKRNLSLGAIAGAGTLGILIPPSIPAVIYAIATEQSVGKILLGGIIPGAIMTVAMMLMIIIRCKINPNLAPVPEHKVTFKEAISSLKNIWAIVILFGGVIGSIYLGWATPTEASAIGCLGALIIAGIKKNLTWANIKEAFDDTVKMTCMIMMISIGAAIFQLFLTQCGFAHAFTNIFVSSNLSKTSLVILLLSMYIPLGMFFDTMGMILLTIPITYPILTAAGIDPIWFGVMVIVMIEISLLTPPVGLNVFVLKGAVADASLDEIFKSVIWYIVVELLVVGLMIAFPQIVMFLPNMMK